MPWTTPNFEEINLSGEVTAYANTDDQVRAAELPATRPAPIAVAGSSREEVASKSAG